MAQVTQLLRRNCCVTIQTTAATESGPYVLIYTVKEIVIDMALCIENGHSDMEANKLLLFFRRERHIGAASV